MTYIWRKKDSSLTALSLSSLHTCHLLLQSICCAVYKSGYNSNVNQLGKNQGICSIGSMWMSSMETNHITALGIMLCSFADHVRYKLVFENDTDTNSCLGPIFKGKMANTHDNTERENFLYCAKLDGNSCLGPILKETMANNHNNCFYMAIHLTK